MALRPSDQAAMRHRRVPRLRTPEPLEPRHCLAAFTFAAIGDFGTDLPQADWVADTVKSWNPDFVITVGDNYYDSAFLDDQPYDMAVGRNWHEFILNYQGEYGAGSPTQRFFPAIGNHDWPYREEYEAFFTLPGNERYYNFAWENVEFFVVNSDNDPDGNDANSIQAAWLRDALAASTADFQIVYFHHPPYTSGLPYGNNETMQWPFAEWGADAVLTGHEHLYERLEADGIPYFVNGLGGHNSTYQFGEVTPESRFRFRDNWGAMLVSVDGLRMDFEFFSTAIPQFGVESMLVDSHTIYATGVVGRHAFYNDSALDGYDPAANAADDAAIAIDKTPLLPGQTAGFANYTTHPAGLTGVMVDLMRLPGSPTVTAADFVFCVGNDDDVASWPLAPPPAVVATRLGAGDFGSDRVTIVWPAGAIVGQWLRVKVKATAATSLRDIDLHFWGNAAGDTGDAPTAAGAVIVDFADAWAISRQITDPPTAAGVDSPHDLNRDGRIDAVDRAMALAHANGLAADLDRDDRVGLGDLVLLQARLGTAAASALDGDLTLDGAVDAADAALLAAGFGGTAPVALAELRLTLITAPGRVVVGSASPLLARAVDRAALARPVDAVLSAAGRSSRRPIRVGAFAVRRDRSVPYEPHDATTTTLAVTSRSVSRIRAASRR